MNQRFLDPILSFEGGWEYWLQIDFPAWLDQRAGDQYDVRREVTGVLPSGRLDWLINSQTSGKKQTAVEIKAQTPKYQSSKFLKGVQLDLHKLSNLGSAYRKIMLTVVTDPDLSKELITQYGFAELFTHGTTVRYLKRDWT